MGYEHLRGPAIIAKGLQDRIEPQGQGLLRTTVHTIKIIFLAAEANTLMRLRPQGLGVIVIPGVHPVGAKLGAQTTGDTTRVSPDDIFTNGMAKPGRGFHCFPQLVLSLVGFHILS